MAWGEHGCSGLGLQWDIPAWSTGGSTQTVVEDTKPGGVVNTQEGWDAIEKGPQQAGEMG